MKFGKVGQIALVSAIALLVATLFSACATLTVGFLYVATNKQTPGQIQVYEVNSESGYLHAIPTSPFPSGGRDPIAESVTPDAKWMYVANEDDNNIVEFGIGTDGKVYPQSTINTPGSFPMALAVNSAGTYLYVVDTLEPIAGCSLTNPCPGAIASYAVTPSSAAVDPGSLGLAPSGCSATDCTLGNAVVQSNGLSYLPLQASPSDSTDVLTPTAIDVLPNGQFVYVTAYNNGVSPSVGYLFAYSVGSGGALTALNGGTPYKLASQPAGQSAPSTLLQPVAVSSDSGGAYLFIVDKGTNQVATYSVQSDGTLSSVMMGGAPTAVTTVTASTGNQPSALTLSQDKFLYVTNSLDSTVTGYTVSSGTLSQIGTYASGVNPIAVTVDPRHIGYLYTVNFLGSSISGYQIDSTTGALTNTQESPYPSSAQPTAVTGIPHAGEVKSAQ